MASWAGSQALPLQKYCSTQLSFPAEDVGIFDRGMTNYDTATAEGEKIVLRLNEK
jgi:hypothetical protein